MTFMKGGYGWSWYRLEKVSTNGEPLPHPNSPWVNNPTLHFGGGIEWVPFWNVESSPFGMDIGIRGEGLIYRHSLGIDLDTVVLTSSGVPIGNAVVTSPLITRYVFDLAVMISF